MFRIRKALTFCALLLATSLCAETPTRSHLDFLAEGNYSAARAVLFEGTAGLPEARLYQQLLEGQIAVRQGRSENAADIFRAILRDAPDFEPARHELAVLLIRTGQRDAAIYHAERLAAKTGDPMLREQVRRFLASQEGALAKRGASARFAIVPSSNVTKGATGDTILIGDTPFTIDPESRAHRGVGLSVGVTAWNRWQLAERWDAVLSGSLDLTEFDTDLAESEQRATARLVVGRMTQCCRLTFGPVAEIRYKEWNPDRTQAGVELGFVTRLSSVDTLSTSLKWVRQSYRAQSFRNGTLTQTNLGWRRVLNSTTALSLSFPIAIESTERPHLDHRDVGVRVGLEKAWKGGLTTGFHLGFTDARYEGDFPGLSDKRHDKIARAGISLRYDELKIGSFTPEISYTIQRSRSNVALYDFSSQDFGIAFVRAF